MAVANKFQSYLKVRHAVGVDKKGADVFKVQSLMKINPETDTDTLCNAADAVAKLYSQPYMIRVDSSHISQH